MKGERRLGERESTPQRDSGVLVRLFSRSGSLYLSSTSCWHHSVAPFSSATLCATILSLPPSYSFPSLHIALNLVAKVLVAVA